MSKIVTCGIIAEYNPFHNGHAYHLKKARELTGADVIVVVMSGQFVQRGEPALIDKQTRTSLALRYGADVVIELPWFGAVQSADYFADVAVKLLGALGVDYLCFGTDDDNDFDYIAFATLLEEHKGELEATYHRIQANHPHASYAKKMDVLYQEVFHDYHVDWSQPNHLLGVSYAKANRTLHRPMKFVTIPRLKAAHRSFELGDFASGTAIRRAALEHRMNEVKEAVPPETYEALTTQPLHTWQDYWPYLQYEVVTSSQEVLAQRYQMTEGLEYRCKKAIQDVRDFESWCQFLQSSRYTRAKIQRLSTYILTKTTQQMVTDSMASLYIKVLGMNEKGRAWFKTTTPLYPVVNNIRHQTKEAFQYEMQYDQIYDLPFQPMNESVKHYHPIIMKKS